MIWIDLVAVAWQEGLQQIGIRLSSQDFGPNPMIVMVC